MAGETMAVRDARRRPDGWWYPYIFVAMFGVIIAVNSVMVYVAVSSFTGLETDQAYLEGLAFNDRLAEAREQVALGWTVDLDVTTGVAGADGSAPGRVDLSFVGPDGAPVEGLDVTVLMVRPTGTRYDWQADLVEAGGGRYGAAVTFPMLGQWEARVVAKRDGEQVYRVHDRLWLR